MAGIMIEMQPLPTSDSASFDSVEYLHYKIPCMRHEVKQWVKNMNLRRKCLNMHKENAI